MKKSFGTRLALSALVLCLMLPGLATAEQFKIAIMQDQQGAAGKFKPLLDYLTKKGIEATFVAARDYPGAAQMFAAGQVDAMFSGSGIAGSMIIKELATPVARPVGRDGISTYWAVVIAPKGGAKFTGKADYFNGRNVVTTGLASAGEFFYRALPGASASTATILKAASHGAALDALDKGQADFAIVKNRVWDKNKDKYPNLAQVGEDKGENPDGTLIVSKKADQKVVAKVTAALLGVKDDASADAKAVKDSLELQGYVKTTEKDFSHTLPMLKSAGVSKAFNFAF
jgi:ABC-type phosphate/phosphonate transport system substrate-binding protein